MTSKNSSQKCSFFLALLSNFQVVNVRRQVRFKFISKIVTSSRSCGSTFGSNRKVRSWQNGFGANERMQDSLP